MQQDTSSKLILCGITLTTIMVALAVWRVARLAGGVDSVIAIKTEGEPRTMQKIIETVTRADGSAATIETARRVMPDGTDESVLAWRTRHDAACAAFRNS